MTVQPSSPLWTPSQPDSTQTARFREAVNNKYGLALKTYEDLHTWSIDHRADFWDSVWDFEEVIGTKGSGRVVDESARPRDNPVWFEGAELNWAENQLRHAKTHPDDIAIIQTSEPCEVYSPAPKRVTQRELVQLVGAAQRAMEGAGLGKGDRVAWYGGNCLEAVVVLLAAASLGAVFSSAAADFGVDGVVERLEQVSGDESLGVRGGKLNDVQIRPKLLFVTNAVVYAGTPRPLLPLLHKLLGSLTSPPSQTVIIPHLPFDIAPVPSDLEGTVKWDDFIDTSSTALPVYKPVGFNDPIWILFSSGTTGKPKAIVHRAGGMLLDSLREHHIAGDISRGDVYFYYTTP